MHTLPDGSRERLAFLRGRLAELREDYAAASKSYQEGRLSLHDEVAQLTDMNRLVYTIVSEAIAITRPEASSWEGE